MLPSGGRTCRTYAELVDALRARRLELDLSFALLDELAGLAPGYGAKGSFARREP
jgi:hypothetical protein